MEVIAVDTGNRLVKTPHFAFNAGLVRHGARLPAIRTDMLCFEGQYYSVTEQRNPYLKDKSEDDTYYILSLFAIGKELCRNGTPTPGKHQIFLAVGLPPTHIPFLRDSYSQYFLSHGREIAFEYNGNHLEVEIARVTVYPQGFSAAADLLGQLKDYPRTYIVDIGGYTTDVVMLAKGKPDMSFCHSFNFGVIHMDNAIQRIVSAQHDVELEDDHIESTLMGGVTLPSGIQATIRKEAERYAGDLMRNLREKGVDPSINMLLFVGGGSELFRDVLTRVCPNALFKTDVKANALGYAKMAARSIGVNYAA